VNQAVSEFAATNFSNTKGSAWVLNGTNRAVGQGMTNITKLLFALLFLFGCDGSDSVDTAPGPADAFVGVWEGTGTSASYSNANGPGPSTPASVVEMTISRVNHAAVSARNNDGGSAMIFDIGEDGYGRLRTGGGSLALKGDVLTIDFERIDNTFVPPIDYSEILTLKRKP
jgi:hypothetical protein